MTSKEKKNMYSEYRRYTLTDGYVRTCLKNRGFKPEDITPELIETQRQIIKIKRLCK